MRRFLLCWLFWMIVFHWWLILRFVPGLRDALGPLAFMHILYWINIPGRPLASVMGPRHFGMEEFGVLPAGPLEYGLIALFWILVAAALGFVTSVGWDRFRPRTRYEGHIQPDDGGQRSIARAASSEDP